MSVRPLSLLPSLAVGVFLAAASSAASGEKWEIAPGRMEISGRMSAEGFAFPRSGRQSGQSRSDLSIAAEPELFIEWQGGRKRLTLAPYARADQRDDRRTDFDLREFHVQFVEDDWDLKIGIGKVHWGVTEARHVVDIVNQSDIAAETDGDAKLGQPMVNLNLHRDWGSLGLFVLPGFRERTFPGRDGRLRTSPRPDTELDATFESGAGASHVDFAARWSHAIGDFDLAVSQFWGTSREPVFEIGVNAGGEVVLIPRYDIIGQTGIELQYTKGATLWKGEAFFRTGQLEDFVALDAGFEHTLTGVFATAADIGLLGEYVYESRPRTRSDGKHYFNYQNNDIMIGLRLTLNDMDNTEGLITASFDLDSSAKFISLELSRRLNDRFKARLEGTILTGLSADEPLFSVRDDDFVRLILEYYF